MARSRIREVLFKFESTKHHKCAPRTLVPLVLREEGEKNSPYWTSTENSLKLIELSRINQVSLV